MIHRILSVDDEPSFCDIIKYNLEQAGFQVDCAHSGEEALQMDLASYGLFIVDINMDDMDGFELVKRIRNRLDTHMIPVIFCSCNDGEDYIVDGLELGADDYVTKPINMTKLLMRVRTVLRRCYPDL